MPKLFATLKRRATEQIDRWRRNATFDVLVRTGSRLFARDMSHMSAGIAYYAILSLFPLLILAVSLASMFFEPEYVQEQVTVFLERFMPVSVDLIERNVQDVIRLRGTASIVGLLLLALSSTALFAALSRIVNRVWNIEETRPFYIEKLRHLGMVVVAGALFAGSIISTAFLEIARSVDIEAIGGSEMWQRGTVQVGAYAAAFGFTTLTFFLIYRFLPHAHVSWQHVLPGAFAAAVLFEALKALFIFYLRNFSNPEMVYGSLASVMTILLWCFLSAHIFIIGTALGAECQIKAREKSSGGLWQSSQAAGS